ALKLGELDVGSGKYKIDFNDTTLRSQLEIDTVTGTDEENEALLKRIVNYINANSANAGSSVGMLKKDDGQYTIQFTSKDASAVAVTGVTALTVQAGLEAKFKINGESFVRNTNEVKDIIPGVSFTIGENIELNKS